MSGVPTETGFTHLGGGDTYVCAFHEATRFNYCWGAINLKPTTTLNAPTSASAPTATGMAMATTATPEPDPCRIVLAGFNDFP